MNNSFRRLLIVAAGVLSANNAALAQRVTVQQPVVQVFSVDTVVSVPDRGSAFLGGVSSAAENRGQYGLFPWGSSAGLDRTHTGVDVGVYIHDFEAMDEYLLRAAGENRSRGWVNPNSRAAAAFDSLREGRNRAAPVHNDRSVSPAGMADRPSTGPPQTDDPAELATFYLARARSAEERGKTGVAMLCYRMAARHGSEFAAEKLRENAE